MKTEGRLKAYQDRIIVLTEVNDLQRDRIQQLIRDVDRLQEVLEVAMEDITCFPHPTTCRYGKDCKFISAVTHRPDCPGCDDFEWRGAGHGGRADAIV